MFEELPNFYTNETQINLSMNDFRLTFFENVSIAKNPLEKRPRCTVSMSPQHLKSLAKVISDQLSLYEKLFGSISLDVDQALWQQVSATSETPKMEG